MMLFAFDLIEQDGDDLRDLPLIDRKWRLAKLIGKAKKWRAIQYSEHLTGDGRPCSSTSAAWGWRGSSRSGWTRPIGADRQRRGSSRRTRRARRCAGSVRRSDGNVARPSSCAQSNCLRWFSLGLHVWRFDTHSNEYAAQA